MILYDSNANKTGMVCKFYGNRLTDKDSSIYESFSKAKEKALSNAKLKLKELQDDIKEIEETTEENCILIHNPFTGYLPDNEPNANVHVALNKEYAKSGGYVVQRGTRRRGEITQPMNQCEIHCFR